MWLGMLKPSISMTTLLNGLIIDVSDIIVTTMVSEIFQEMSDKFSPLTAARSSFSGKQFSVLYIKIPFSG